jgi:spermidine/putrescine transport system permease protein
LISNHIRSFFIILFVLGFFAYLFGPLILMSLTAFNSSAFPRVSPWECFSVEWFEVLSQDQRLLEGLRNSLVIGIGVVCLSVPLGLAGALMLTQVRERIRPWYYMIVISPILVPGVVLGISTLLFWDRVGLMFGMSRESIFYNGIFLTIIGQSTFISAYTMLLFIARLQRFDHGLNEAAMDLGATSVQAFIKILLPFLKPAIASAAVLAFLASFENYNTTVFTIVAESTLTTVLASKVRYGINPSISALAVVIVAITLFGAAIFEVFKRRDLAAQKESKLVARGKLVKTGKKRPLQWVLDPALIMIVLVTIAGIGTLYFAGTVGIDECKVMVKEEKQRNIQQKVRRQQQKAMFKSAAPSERPSSTPDAQQKVRAKGTEQFKSVFDTGNLTGDSAPQEEEKTKAKGTEQFKSVFDPGNLKESAGAKEEE